MKPTILQLRIQPAPANLLSTTIKGSDTSVFVPISRSNGSAPGGSGGCVWRDEAVSIFVRAQQGKDGLVIDLRVVVDPPPPVAATVQEAA